MDIASLFTAKGRFGRKQFWLSWLGLVGVSLLVSWLPLIVAAFVRGPGVDTVLPVFSLIATFVVFYCQTCITAKRLHDMHRSGWLQAIPMALCVLVGIGGGMVARLAGAPNVVEIAGALVTLIGAAFLIWIGVTPSDSRSNRFGPPTGRLAAAEAFA